MGKRRNGDLRRRVRGRAGQRGITLVELLVVLAILALVSAVVVVNILPERDRAAVKKAAIDISVLSAALDQYRLDMLNYPTTEQGLRALSTAPANARRIENYRPGGYIKALPLDPWGNDYQYVIPGERGGGYDLFSLGADGEPGGEGLDADIGNWQEN
ncbi:MAG: type II secretion system major pseudopilin GspG [Pseudomonadota bacterium]